MSFGEKQLHRFYPCNWDFSQGAWNTIRSTIFISFIPLIFLRNSWTSRSSTKKELAQQMQEYLLQSKDFVLKSTFKFVLELGSTFIFFNVYVKMWNEFPPEVYNKSLTSCCLKLKQNFYYANVVFMYLLKHRVYL